MKKLYILLFLFTAAAVQGFAAEQVKTVSIRFSEQDGIIRIVLDADEQLINSANTVVSLSSVRIDFPYQFTLKKPTAFPYEAYQKDRSIIIRLKDVLDVKTARLSSPARIVLDVKIPAKQAAKGGWTSIQTSRPAQQAAPPTQQTSSAPAERPRLPKNIVIDPGHGGYDYGIIFKDGREKDFCLDTARDLAALLSKSGAKPVLTRRVDQAMTIADRSSFATAQKPDIFISIHSASGDNFVLYTATPEDQNSDAALRPYSVAGRQDRYREKSRQLAKAISEALQADFKKTVIFRELPLPLLAVQDAPAVMLEAPATDQIKSRDRIVKAIQAGMQAQ